VSTGGPNLTAANLTGANLTGAAGADLTGANLSGASLNEANLYGANLSGADLTWENPTGAKLSGNVTVADFLKLSPLLESRQATAFGETIFADTNLTGAIGLEYCVHLGPSILDHRTLQECDQQRLG
jgi:surface antigen